MFAQHTNKKETDKEMETGPANKRLSQRTKLKIGLIVIVIVGLVCGILFVVANPQKWKADKLCRDFYRDFHAVLNPDLVTNDEIGHGATGTVS